MLQDSCVYLSSVIENERSCNSYAILKNNSFIKIMYFIYDTEANHRPLCLCYQIDTVEHEHSSSIHICTNVHTKSMLIDIEDIAGICVYMEIEDLRFISSCPNLLDY